MIDERDPKAIVREGYDLVSHAYRADEFPFEGSGYQQWLGRVTPRLADGARVLDLGCGCGVPIARELSRRFRVTGIDLSPVQIDRARRLVPQGEFICADIGSYEYAVDAWDAIVAFFTIIHLPVAEQPSLIRRLAESLRPGGLLFATVGHEAWTGTEPDWRGVPGATMYWSHADLETYATWFSNAGLEIVDRGLWERPDETFGVLLGQRPAAAARSR